ncbi:M15 family metallopeptidase [Flavobacteriaceae bacterium]|nr:M15 family metallopeptidase [Flavobacteriaceae bacterium]
MRIILFLSLIYSFNTQASNDTIIDANFSRIEVFSGKIIPNKVVKSQTIITVFYYGFDNKIHQGQVVCHYLFADKIKSVFEMLLKDKFSIFSVIPVHHFNWSDTESMKANNTSCFNFRKSQNGQTSEHSKGLAIDINPFQNPYISRKSKAYPKGATYNINEKGTITKGSNIIKYFQKIGWKWGGNWKYSKDYQHFSSNGR